MRIREATSADSSFLAGIILMAERAHLRLGLTEYMTGRPEETVMDLWERVTISDEVHMCHYSTFLIAEVDGARASALCGFDPRVHGIEVVRPVWWAAALAVGVTEEEGTEIGRRSAPIARVLSDYEPEAWVIENVATLPAYRRRGLTDALFAAILDRGRSLGFGLSQISVSIGNEPARMAYIKHGFVLKDERRDSEFEAALGSPGMQRLLRTL